MTGPLTAPTGTRDRKPRVGARTHAHRQVVAAPVAAVEDDLRAPSARPEPAILIVLPPWARARDAQRRTHVTFETFGRGDVHAAATAGGLGRGAGGEHAQGQAERTGAAPRGKMGFSHSLGLFFPPAYGVS